MTEVRLTKEEYQWAVERANEKKAHSRKNNFGLGQSKPQNYGGGIQSEITGIVGEVTTRKMLGYPIKGVPVDGHKDAGDVGTKIQVRCTEYPHGCLVVRDNDRENDFGKHLNKPFVLVTRKSAEDHLTYVVRGYIQLTSSIKDRDEWVRDYGDRGNPGWFIPQNKLKPLEPEFYCRSGATAGVALKDGDLSRCSCLRKFGAAAFYCGECDWK